MLTELQNMYNELKGKNEKAIIEKYGDNAERYTAMLTCNIF
jgi:abortive infection bacteriophage resistance protein